MKASISVKDYKNAGEYKDAIRKNVREIRERFPDAKVYIQKGNRGTNFIAFGKELERTSIYYHNYENKEEFEKAISKAISKLFRKYSKSFINKERLRNRIDLVAYEKFL